MNYRFIPTTPAFIRKLHWRLGSLTALLLAFGASLQAQYDPNADPDLLVYDGFNYSPSFGFDLTVFQFVGSPDSGKGWQPGNSGLWKWRTNFDGKGSSVSSGSKLQEGSLKYGGLLTTGHHVRLTGENGSLELGRGFENPIAGTAGTRTYISFLADRSVGPEADPDSPAYDNPDTPQIETYPYGSNLYPRSAAIRFFSVDSTGANFDEDLSIGRFSNRSTDVWSTYGSMPDQVTSVPYGAGGLAFVVIRIDHIGGPDDPDDLYMWVNPDLFAGEDTAAADMSFSNLFDGTNAVDFSNLVFVSPFAGNASVDPGPDEVLGTEDDLVVRPHAEMLFDEFRIGKTWDSVAPFFPIPEIRQQPADVSVPAGQTATFAVTAVGQDLSYQWKKGTTNVGTNSAEYSIPSTAFGDAGTYSVTITNSFGSVTSEEASLTVTDGPVGPSIIADPAGADLIEGDSTTLTVEASGNTPLNYVWMKDGVALGDAPSSPTLNLDDLTAADAGIYTVMVSNNVGSVTSAGAELVVEFSVGITDHPSSVAASAGSSVTLSVTAEGLPLPTYQWFKDDVELAGETASTLELTNLDAADVGTYWVAAANTPGGAQRLVLSDRAGVTLLSTMSRTNVMAATGTTDVPVDAPITLTFDEPVQAGFAGKMHLFEEDHTLVETIDLSAATHRREVGGEGFNYLPVLADGNSVILTFPTALEYGKTYYVTLEGGVIQDLDGEGYVGISDENTLRFSVRSDAPAADALELWVNGDGSADFATLQGAFDHVPSGETRRSIYVANGHYVGQYFLEPTKQNIRIVGETRDGVMFSYPNNSELNESRQRPVMYLRGNGLELYSVTVMNSSPQQEGLMSDALSVQAQSAKVVNVAVSSYSNAVRVDGAVLFQSCYIEGAVDIVWGEGAGFFQECTIHSLATGNVVDPRNILEAEGYDPGFVFNNCTLTAEAGVTGVLLGSVDEVTYPGAEAVFINCEMGSHIAPVGWALEGDPTGALDDLVLAEYQSTNLSGAALDVSQRLSPGSMQLTVEQTAAYDLLAFLGETYDLGGIYGVEISVDAGVTMVHFLATAGLPVEIRSSPNFIDWSLFESVIGTGDWASLDVSSAVSTGGVFFEAVDPADEIVEPGEGE